MFVVAVGNPFDGIELIGPFESADEANEYADQSFGGKDTWWVMKVEPAYEG